MKRYVLDVLNRLLDIANLRMETLTRQRGEARRLNGLAKNGQFDKPVYGPFRQVLLEDLTWLLTSIDAKKDVYSKFSATSLNDVDYSFDNAYFSSPDTEVLYALIGFYRPRRDHRGGQRQQHQGHAAGDS